MLIKLKTQMAGPDGCHAAGSRVEFDRETAEALIKGGYGEHVGDGPAAGWGEPTPSAPSAVAPAEPEAAVLSSIDEPAEHGLAVGDPPAPAKRLPARKKD